MAPVLDAKPDDPIPLCNYARHPKPAAGAFSIKNGDPADPSKYPALFYYFGSSGLCTASLVAPQTMITARHCVRDFGKISTPIVWWAFPKAVATCRHATPTDDSPRLDIALCHLDRPLAGPYESLNRDPGRIEVSKKPRILLVGFGCGKSDEPDPKNPQFRTGGTNIDRIDGGAYVAVGGAAVCLGDSGGPAFLELADGRRLQIAVNAEEATADTSWLSSTSSPAAVTFIVGWASPQQNDQRICGFDPHAQHCQ